jgi:hypothetical protein
MNAARHAVVALGCSVFFVACGDPISELTPQSEFIFVGTVLLLNTSTIGVEDAQGLSVVRVDEIVRPADGFSVLPGDQITVRLKDPASTRKEMKRVFFTKGWLYGESLGVVEVGNIDAPARLADVRERVHKVTAREQERALTERIQATELIVRGVVQRVSRLPSQNEVSEHAPDWHTAVVKIDEVLKGSHTGQTITIMFPRSDDVMWYRAPRYDEGTRGVWLLRTTTVGGRKLQFLSALEPEDFYTGENEAKILRFLKK